MITNYSTLSMSYKEMSKLANTRPVFHFYLYYGSAGIGRTGAFCCLTTAIERVKAEGLVDVFYNIKHLRTQRAHMVQSVVRHSLHDKFIEMCLFVRRYQPVSSLYLKVAKTCHISY